MHGLSTFFTCFLHESDHFCGVFLCFWTTSNWSFGMIPMGYMVIKRPWILGHPGGCGSGLSSMSISSCRFSAWRKSTTPAIFGRCHGATCVGTNISTRRSQFHVASGIGVFVICSTTHLFNAQVCLQGCCSERAGCLQPHGLAIGSQGAVNSMNSGLR